MQKPPQPWNNSRPRAVAPSPYWPLGAVLFDSHSAARSCFRVQRALGEAAGIRAAASSMPSSPGADRPFRNNPDGTRGGGGSTPAPPSPTAAPTTRGDSPPRSFSHAMDDDFPSSGRSAPGASFPSLPFALFPNYVVTVAVDCSKSAFVIAEGRDGNACVLMDRVAIALRCLIRSLMAAKVSKGVVGNVQHVLVQVVMANAPQEEADMSPHAAHDEGEEGADLWTEDATAAGSRRSQPPFGRGGTRRRGDASKSQPVPLDVLIPPIDVLDAGEAETMKRIEANLTKYITQRCRLSFLRQAKHQRQQQQHQQQLFHSIVDPPGDGGDGAASFSSASFARGGAVAVGDSSTPMPVTAGHSNILWAEELDTDGILRSAIQMFTHAECCDAAQTIVIVGNVSPRTHLSMPDSSSLLFGSCVVKDIMVLMIDLGDNAFMGGGDPDGDGGGGDVGVLDFGPLNPDGARKWAGSPGGRRAILRRGITFHERGSHQLHPSASPSSGSYGGAALSPHQGALTSRVAFTVPVPTAHAIAAAWRGKNASSSTAGGARASLRDEYRDANLSALSHFLKGLVGGRIFAYHDVERHVRAQTLGAHYTSNLFQKAHYESPVTPFSDPHWSLARAVLLRRFTAVPIAVVDQRLFKQLFAPRQGDHVSDSLEFTFRLPGTCDLDAVVGLLVSNRTNRGWEVAVDVAQRKILATYPIRLHCGCGQVLLRISVQRLGDGSNASADPAAAPHVVVGYSRVIRGDTPLVHLIMDAISTTTATMQAATSPVVVDDGGRGAREREGGLHAVNNSTSGGGQFSPSINRATVASFNISIPNSNLTSPTAAPTPAGDVPTTFPVAQPVESLLSPLSPSRVPARLTSPPAALGASSVAPISSLLYGVTTIRQADRPHAAFHARSASNSDPSSILGLAHPGTGSQSLLGGSVDAGGQPSWSSVTVAPAALVLADSSSSSTNKPTDDTKGSPNGETAAAATTSLATTSSRTYDTHWTLAIMLRAMDVADEDSAWLLCAEVGTKSNGRTVVGTLEANTPHSSSGGGRSPPNDPGCRTEPATPLTDGGVTASSGAPRPESGRPERSNIPAAPRRRSMITVSSSDSCGGSVDADNVGEPPASQIARERVAHALLRHSSFAGCSQHAFGCYLVLPAIVTVREAQQQHCLGLAGKRAQVGLMREAVRRCEAALVSRCGWTQLPSLAAEAVLNAMNYSPLLQEVAAGAAPTSADGRPLPEVTSAAAPLFPLQYAAFVRSWNHSSRPCYLQLWAPDDDDGIDNSARAALSTDDYAVNHVAAPLQFHVGAITFRLLLPHLDLGTGESQGDTASETVGTTTGGLGHNGMMPSYEADRQRATSWFTAQLSDVKEQLEQRSQPSPVAVHAVRPATGGSARPLAASVYAGTNSFIVGMMHYLFTGVRRCRRLLDTQRQQTLQQTATDRRDRLASARQPHRSKLPLQHHGGGGMRRGDEEAAAVAVRPPQVSQRQRHLERVLASYYGLEPPTVLGRWSIDHAPTSEWTVRLDASSSSSPATPEAQSRPTLEGLNGDDAATSALQAFALVESRQRQGFTLLHCNWFPSLASAGAKREKLDSITGQPSSPSPSGRSDFFAVLAIATSAATVTATQHNNMIPGGGPCQPNPAGVGLNEDIDRVGTVFHVIEYAVASRSVHVTHFRVARVTRVGNPSPPVVVAEPLQQKALPSNHNNKGTDVVVSSSGSGVAASKRTATTLLGCYVPVPSFGLFPEATGHDEENGSAFGASPQQQHLGSTMSSGHGGDSPTAEFSAPAMNAAATNKAAAPPLPVAIRGAIAPFTADEPDDDDAHHPANISLDDHDHPANISIMGNEATGLVGMATLDEGGETETDAGGGMRRCRSSASGMWYDEDTQSLVLQTPLLRPNTTDEPSWSSNAAATNHLPVDRCSAFPDDPDGTSAASRRPDARTDASSQPPAAIVPPSGVTAEPASPRGANSAVGAKTTPTVSLSWMNRDVDSLVKAVTTAAMLGVASSLRKLMSPQRMNAVDSTPQRRSVTIAPRSANVTVDATELAGVASAAATGSLRAAGSGAVMDVVVAPVLRVANAATDTPHTASPRWTDLSFRHESRTVTAGVWLPSLLSAKAAGTYQRVVCAFPLYVLDAERLRRRQSSSTPESSLSASMMGSHSLHEVLQLVAAAVWCGPSDLLPPAAQNAIREARIASLASRQAAIWGECALVSSFHASCEGGGCAGAGTSCQVTIAALPHSPFAAGSNGAGDIVIGAVDIVIVATDAAPAADDGMRPEMWWCVTHQHRPANLQFHPRKSATPTPCDDTHQGNTLLLAAQRIATLRYVQHLVPTLLGHLTKAAASDGSVQPDDGVDSAKQARAAAKAAFCFLLQSDAAAFIRCGDAPSTGQATPLGSAMMPSRPPIPLFVRYRTSLVDYRCFPFASALRHDATVLRSFLGEVVSLCKPGDEYLHTLSGDSGLFTLGDVGPGAEAIARLPAACRFKLSVGEEIVPTVRSSPASIAAPQTAENVGAVDCRREASVDLVADARLSQEKVAQLLSTVFNASSAPSSSLLQVSRAAASMVRRPVILDVDLYTLPPAYVRLLASGAQEEESPALGRNGRVQRSILEREAAWGIVAQIMSTMHRDVPREGASELTNNNMVQPNSGLALPAAPSVVGSSHSSSSSPVGLNEKTDFPLINLATCAAMESRALPSWLRSHCAAVAASFVTPLDVCIVRCVLSHPEVLDRARLMSSGMPGRRGDETASCNAEDPEETDQLAAVIAESVCSPMLRTRIELLRFPVVHEGMVRKTNSAMIQPHLLDYLLTFSDQIARGRGALADSQRAAAWHITHLGGSDGVSFGDTSATPLASRPAQHVSLSSQQQTVSSSSSVNVPVAASDATCKAPRLAVTITFPAPVHVTPAPPPTPGGRPPVASPPPHSQATRFSAALSGALRPPALLSATFVASTFVIARTSTSGSPSRALLPATAVHRLSAVRIWRSTEPIAGAGGVVLVAEFFDSHVPSPSHGDFEATPVNARGATVAFLTQALTAATSQPPHLLPPLLHPTAASLTDDLAAAIESSMVQFVQVRHLKRIADEQIVPDAQVIPEGWGGYEHASPPPGVVARRVLAAVDGQPMAPAEKRNPPVGNAAGAILARRSSFSRPASTSAAGVGASLIAPSPRVNVKLTAASTLHTLSTQPLGGASAVPTQQGSGGVGSRGVDRRLWLPGRAVLRVSIGDRTSFNTCLSSIEDMFDHFQVVGRRGCFIISDDDDPSVNYIFRVVHIVQEPKAGKLRGGHRSPLVASLPPGVSSGDDSTSLMSSASEWDPSAMVPVAAAAAVARSPLSPLTASSGSVASGAGVVLNFDAHQEDAALMRSAASPVGVPTSTDDAELGGPNDFPAHGWSKNGDFGGDLRVDLFAAVGSAKQPKINNVLSMLASCLSLAANRTFKSLIAAAQDVPFLAMDVASVKLLSVTRLISAKLTLAAIELPGALRKALRHAASGDPIKGGGGHARTHKFMATSSLLSTPPPLSRLFSHLARDSATMIELRDATWSIRGGSHDFFRGSGSPVPGPSPSSRPSDVDPFRCIYHGGDGLSIHAGPQSSSIGATQPLLLLVLDPVASQALQPPPLSNHQSQGGSNSRPPLSTTATSCPFRTPPATTTTTTTPTVQFTLQVLSSASLLETPMPRVEQALVDFMTVLRQRMDTLFLQGVLSAAVVDENNIDDAFDALRSLSYSRVSPRPNVRAVISDGLDLFAGSTHVASASVEAENSSRPPSGSPRRGMGGALPLAEHAGASSMMVYTPPVHALHVRAPRLLSTLLLGWAAQRLMYDILVRGAAGAAFSAHGNATVSVFISQRRRWTNASSSSAPTAGTSFPRSPGAERRTPPTNDSTSIPNAHSPTHRGHRNRVSHFVSSADEAFLAEVDRCLDPHIFVTLRLRTRAHGTRRDPIPHGGDAHHHDVLLPTTSLPWIGEHGRLCAARYWDAEGFVHAAPTISPDSGLRSLAENNARYFDDGGGDDHFASREYFASVAPTHDGGPSAFPSAPAEKSDSQPHMSSGPPTVAILKLSCEGIDGVAFDARDVPSLTAILEAIVVEAAERSNVLRSVWLQGIGVPVPAGYGCPPAMIPDDETPSPAAAAAVAGSAAHSKESELGSSAGADEAASKPSHRSTSDPSLLDDTIGGTLRRRCIAGSPLTQLHLMEEVDLHPIGGDRRLVTEQAAVRIARRLRREQQALLAVSTNHTATRPLCQQQPPPPPRLPADALPLVRTRSRASLLTSRCGSLLEAVLVRMHNRRGSLTASVSATSSSELLQGLAAALLQDAEEAITLAPQSLIVRKSSQSQMAMTDTSIHHLPPAMQSPSFLSGSFATRGAPLSLPPLCHRAPAVNDMALESLLPPTHHALAVQSSKTVSPAVSSSAGRTSSAVAASARSRATTNAAAVGYLSRADLRKELSIVLSDLSRLIEQLAARGVLQLSASSSLMATSPSGAPLPMIGGTPGLALDADSVADPRGEALRYTLRVATQLRMRYSDAVSSGYARTMERVNRILVHSAARALHWDALQRLRELWPSAASSKASSSAMGSSGVTPASAVLAQVTSALICVHLHSRLYYALRVQDLSLNTDDRQFRTDAMGRNVNRGGGGGIDPSSMLLGALSGAATAAAGPRNTTTASMELRRLVNDAMRSYQNFLLASDPDLRVFPLDPLHQESSRVGEMHPLVQERLCWRFGKVQDGPKAISFRPNLLYFVKPLYAAAAPPTTMTTASAAAPPSKMGAAAASSPVTSLPHSRQAVSKTGGPSPSSLLESPGPELMTSHSGMVSFTSAAPEKSVATADSMMSSPSKREPSNKGMPYHHGSSNAPSSTDASLNRMSSSQPVVGFVLVELGFQYANYALDITVADGGLPVAAAGQQAKLLRHKLHFASFFYDAFVARVASTVSNRTSAVYGERYYHAVAAALVQLYPEPPNHSVNCILEVPSSSQKVKSLADYLRASAASAARAMGMPPTEELEGGVGVTSTSLARPVSPPGQASLTYNVVAFMTTTASDARFYIMLTSTRPPESIVDEARARRHSGKLKELGHRVEDELLQQLRKETAAASGRALWQAAFDNMAAEPSRKCVNLISSLVADDLEVLLGFVTSVKLTADLETLRTADRHAQIDWRAAVTTGHIAKLASRIGTGGAPMALRAHGATVARGSQELSWRVAVRHAALLAPRPASPSPPSAKQPLAYIVVKSADHFVVATIGPKVRQRNLENRRRTRRIGNSGRSAATSSDDCREELRSTDGGGEDDPLHHHSDMRHGAAARPSTDGAAAPFDDDGSEGAEDDVDGEEKEEEDDDDAFGVERSGTDLFSSSWSASSCHRPPPPPAGTPPTRWCIRDMALCRQRLMHGTLDSVGLRVEERRTVDELLAGMWQCLWLSTLPTSAGS